MAKTKEYEAKTTQEALDIAVADTGIPLSELKFEIISQGGGGIFGLSLKKAKIKVFLPEPAEEKEKEKEKEKKKTRPKRSKRKPRGGGRDRRAEADKPGQAEKTTQPPPAAAESEDEPSGSGWAAPSRPAPKPETAPEPEIVADQPPADEPPRAEAEPAETTTPDRPESPEATLDKEPEPEPPTPTGWAAPSRMAPLPKKKRKEINIEALVGRKKPVSTGVDVDLTSESDRRAERGKPDRRSEPPRARNRKPQSERSRPPRAKTERFDRNRNEAKARRRGPAEPYQPRVSDPNAPSEYVRTDEDQANLAKAKEILETILEKMVGPTKVDASWVEEKMYLNLHGDGSGLLIGRKGQTLDALQFIVSKIVDKHSGRHYRIMIDTEGYRGRREETLVQQAEALAERVIRSGRPARTGPLNPHERRIVHLALMPNEQVRTGSQGEGTFKRVVISPRRGGRRDR